MIQQPDLFPMIFAGHLIGDYIVQTDWQATNKETNWAADLMHTLTYNLTMALMVLSFWHTKGALVFLLISTLSHALFDRRWPTRWVLTHTRSPNFSRLMWGVIATDQAIHLSILGVSYFLLTRYWS